MKNWLYILIALIVITTLYNTSQWSKPTIVYGGITNTGTIYASTTNHVMLSGNRTIYVSFLATDVTSKSYLLTTPALVSMQLYIEGGKLVFRNPASFISGTQGKWTTDITANVKYQMALRFLFDTDETQNPEVWLNGAQVTMTETITPVLSQSNANWFLEFGSFLGGSPLWGYLDEVALFSTKLSDDSMATISGSRLRGMPQQYSTVTNYWSFDTLTANSSTLYIEFQDWVGTSTVKGGNGTATPNTFLSY